MLKIAIIIILLFITYGYRRYVGHKRKEIRNRRKEILDRLRDRD